MKRVLYILLSVCLFAASFADASAQVDKREVRKGNRRFKDGEYTEAQMEYMKAVAKDTLSVAANYNLANTLFRQEDYDNAAKALERLEETAVASVDGASVYYNQGAVAIAQQNWQKAVEAFSKSLLMNPDDLDAKENYIYAKKMLQDQQQNQQNQDQNQDQNQNDDQNQDQNQDNKDNQQDQNDQNQDQNDDKDNGDDQKDDQGQNQQDQNQQNQDQQNQGQQPQISPQAAQQMLQAIQAKEKETQDKVNKAKAAALKSRQKEKNW
jgi:tetratricopeptide (TPR) repeat protein